MKSFTTSRGVTVEFQSIEVLFEKLRAQYHDPAPPTYEVVTATGVKETHTHDATTLESDEDRAAWSKYLAECARIESERNEALVKLALLRGIKIELPADEAWMREQEFMRIPIPSNPLERKIHYLTTEVFITADDYAGLMAGVMEASGVSEEVLRQAEDTFRHPVERAAGNAAEGPAASEIDQGLVQQPKARRSRSRMQSRNSGHAVRPVG